MIQLALSMALGISGMALQRAIPQPARPVHARPAAIAAPAQTTAPQPGGWSFQFGNNTVQAGPASFPANVSPAPGLHAFWIDAPHPSPPLAGVPLRDKEIFLLGIPPQPLQPAAPLLVGFHSYNVGPDDVVLNTDLWSECQARGWYFCAPLSRSSAGSPQIHFAELDSQENTEAALKWVTEQLPINPNRIYGVGFSMGGSIATSYAARHLDPADPMFAALVSHTASVDQAHTWQAATNTGNPSAISEIEVDFGGAPALRPFAYRRASLIELNLNTGAPLPNGRHLVGNLAHVPTNVWYSTADPETYLVDQSREFYLLLAAAGGTGSTQTLVGDPVHSWSTLDAAAACDWLDPQRRTLPLNGTLHADRDGAWFHLDIQREATNQFGAIRFAVSPFGSQVELLDSENIDVIETDMSDWGVTPASPLLVRLSSVDGGDLVRIGVPGLGAPAIAFRDGVVVSAGNGWVFDVGAGVLVVDESGNPGTHTWEFF